MGAIYGRGRGGGRQPVRGNPSRTRLCCAGARGDRTVDVGRTAKERLAGWLAGVGSGSGGRRYFRVSRGRGGGGGSAADREISRRLGKVRGPWVVVVGYTLACRGLPTARSLRIPCVKTCAGVHSIVGFCFHVATAKLGQSRPERER